MIPGMAVQETTASQAGATGPTAATKIPPIPAWAEAVLNAITILALVSGMAVIFADVVARAVFQSSLLWGEEIAHLALTVVAFLGGVMAYQRGQHMAVHAVINRLPVGWRQLIAAAVDWIVCGLAVVILVLGYPVFVNRWSDRTLILEISLAWYILPLLVGMVLLAAFALWRLYWQPRRKVAAAGIVTLGLALVLVLVCTAWGPFNQGQAVLGGTMAVFLVLLFAAVPIGFVLPLCSLLYLYASGSAPLFSVPINMQGGIASFVLLAIPFFILAGFIMTEGGMTRPLAEFVQTLVGHLRGGLLQVIVVTMYIFSGISGSKMADVAAVGTAMKEILRKEGYPPAEAVVVLASSAVMGETVPPSIAMLVLGSITTISVGALFLAGLIPAAIMATCLMVLIYVRARLAGHQSAPRATWKARGQAARRALPALLVPVVLVGGIVSGVATPTEVSAFAVAYALILSMVFYRNLKFTDLRRILVETARMSGMLLFIIGAATTFSWTLTIANLPHVLVTMLGAVGGSRWLFMLGSVVCLVLVGALLEGLPAVLVFAPMLLPVAAQLGIDPLHYSIVLIIAMGIGHFSPPIGVGLYVACSVGGATIEETTPRMLPYLIMLGAGLLILAFVPWFSVVFPHLLRLGR